MVAGGVARAVGGGHLPAPEPTLPAQYDPALINADTDLIALARAVLTRTGFDPNRPIAPACARLVPVRLATAELFERYMEVRLRRLPGWRVWAGYHDHNLGPNFWVRPDFLAWHKDGRRVIVDAKYKNFARQKSGGVDEDNSLRPDVYQTLAYSRHRAVRKTLGGEATAIVLCYPARGEENAADRLAAALAGENPPAFRLDDVSLPVILLALPTSSRAD